MSKITTPAMERIAKKQSKKRNNKPEQEEKSFSFMADAWKRFSRNKMAMVGLCIIILLLLIALFAKYLIPYSYVKTSMAEAYQFPNAKHWFGTDHLGRDIFSRCIYASRVSLPMGIICAIVSICMGGFVGLVAAFFMGTVDNVLMRIMDIFQAIPGTLMAICVVASLGTGVPQLVFAIAIGGLPMFAKTVRSAVFTVRDRDYIEATRAIGAKSFRLMFRHILPNCIGHFIITVVSSVAGNIMVISVMSYIGLGIQPPLPEWGYMLADGKAYISSYWYMVAFPGLFILLTVYAFFLLGDGVRDALDPNMK